MRKKHYRADIDGLRAVAVVGVILFHANIGLAGGYVGVDVFFVISGYLITQIIARETNEERFSLQRFWVRRIRRILPAAGLVVLTTFLTGLIVLEPRALIGLGKSGVSYSLMIANLFFYHSSGYFSESAELQPLLHTWSLSVEEQFYVVLPLTLVFVLRRQPKWAFPLLSVAAVVSFLLSVSQLNANPSAAFYLLPSRAWELLAGALLAIGGCRLTLGRSTNEILAVIGLGSIVYSMLYYTQATPFPGLAAVLPVAGATLLIATNMHQTTFVGQLLSRKLLVGVGLISYSLYLWHWPVLVFCRHLFVDESVHVTGAALMLTAVLSYLSWRFVETPFRDSQRLRTPAAAFRFAATVTAIVGGAGLLFILQRGLPRRFNEPSLAIIEDIVWTGSEYQEETSSGVPIGVERTGITCPDFVLWGDSHGMAVSALVDKLAKEGNLSGNALLSSGLPPVTGLWKPLKGLTREISTTSLNQSRYDWIVNCGVKHVVLVARWESMIDGLHDAEINERTGKVRNYSMVVDRPGLVPSHDVSQRALKSQLTQMVKRLAMHEVKVWLVLQVPAASQANVARDFFLINRFPSLNQRSIQLDTRKADYQQRRAETVELLASIQSENLEIVDPIDAFYGTNKRLRLYGERSYYRDEDHLTRPGAEFFLRSVYEDIFSRIHEQD
ncbi:O-acetyltransferase OatA [Planctomycetes bacterium CA13]|uniref:O-acetyltransferase OatA n=1 Tax=Novipirellula herctigrandis TaxID=2527986 RepID=A0A5C5ZAM3_9BACT|nr:O-acetyltransferase OatA [Planctomycetes bacterium CA13]